MNRTVPACEKNIIAEPFPPVVIAPNTTQTVLPNNSRKSGEWATRAIQNVGANECKFAIGRDCLIGDYNGSLQPGQQLDCTIYGLSQVSVYSNLGTTIAIVSMKRVDNDIYPTYVPSI